MGKVAIIDYGMGNIDSVRRAVEVCGREVIIADRSKKLDDASHIIIPGVGSYSEGMENLKNGGFISALNKYVIDKKLPLLGICLGMQLLSDKGYELKEADGLKFIHGEVVLLEPVKIEERIPHVGWNEVIIEKNSAIFNNIPSGKDFYFIHSYHFVCADSLNIIAKTPYCDNFISAIQKDNIFGVQFHPEKSQKLGLELIKNFLEY